MNGVPIARLFGIEVRLHLSWIFIVVIVTASVGNSLSALEPSDDAAQAWLIGIVASIVFMATVVAHELAHALVARRSGMAVDAISVHFIGSPAVVDVRGPTPRAEAAIALAGPITSLLIGLTCVGIALVASRTGPGALRTIADVLVIVGALDLVLAVVSLVPAYPLDGGRVVRAIGWARVGDARQGAKLAAMVGRGVGWLLVGAGLAVILFGEMIGMPLEDRILNGIMVGIIGWFLGASARSVERWVVLDALIAGVRVSEAMEEEVETVSPQLTLDTFGPQVLDGTLGPALPVFRAGVLIGMVGAGQLRSVPRRDWPSTRTAEVMVGLADVPTVGPDESLTEGLERLRESRLDGLPVLEGTDLRGVLTRRSVAVALRALADIRGLTL
ncbi:MAG TPA: M50 family metallopeptidase [Candidatus Limnocylindrales bacterium]|nr:M50 family metallopeptidase [Candidatus Limnocylindrales bacterium]